MSPAAFLNGLGQVLPPSTPSSNRRKQEAPLMVGNSESDLVTVIKRHEQFEQYDREKAKFVNVGIACCSADHDSPFQELVTRYQYLSQQFDALLLERKQEHDWMMSWQNEKQQYEKWIKNMQRAMVSPSFKLAPARVLTH